MSVRRRDRDVRRRAPRSPARDRGGARDGAAGAGADVSPAPAGRPRATSSSRSRRSSGGWSCSPSSGWPRRPCSTSPSRSRSRSRRSSPPRSSPTRTSSSPARTSASAASAAAISSCSSGSATRCGRCRCSRASRRPRSGAGCTRARSSRRRSCSAALPELDGVVVPGDQRGGTLGYPTANLAVDPTLLVPRYGIYAGAALGPPRGDLDRHESALRRRGAADRAVPARLRGRPLRPAAGRRALGAAARRAGVRVGAGARRADQPRRRGDAKGRPSGVGRLRP